MRLIFINRYFHPDYSATSQMLSDLAFALAERGHCVSILTSRLRYDDPQAVLPPCETICNVAVNRLWTSRFGRHNLAGRAIDYATFHLSMAWALWRLTRPGDIVIAKTDPPMLPLLTTPIAHWRGARAVTWLQDLFPEVAEAAGMFEGNLSWLAATLRWLRRGSLRNADMTVAIGRLMVEKLKHLGVPEERIVFIPNWADCTLITPREHSTNLLRCDWDVDGKFVVAHCGNLGRAHDAKTILAAIDAVAAAKPTADIVWIFVGGGAGYQALRLEVCERDLKNVRFLPYHSRDLLAESLCAADVHIVSLLPEFEGLVVPSKFYGIAAAGRPTLFIGDTDGEIATVLRDAQCGLTARPGDGPGLASYVLDLAGDIPRCQAMGRRGRDWFEKSYDKSIAVASWCELMRSLESGPARSVAPEPRHSIAVAALRTRAPDTTGTSAPAPPPARRSAASRAP